MSVLLPRQSYQFRYAERRDVKKILALDAMQEPGKQQLSESQLLAELRKASPGICLLAEEGGSQSVDGYVLYQWEAGPNEAMQDLRVSRLLVHPDERYGEAETGLVEEMKKRARKFQCKAVYVARETDLGQQVLLSAAGFRAVRVERGFYLDSGEDGYLFEYQGSEQR